MSTRNAAKSNQIKMIQKLNDFFSWNILVYGNCFIGAYVWMISITTIPKVSDDWNPLTGWPFHDKPPMQPRNINIAVPINSARNMASVSTVFFPILVLFPCKLEFSNVIEPKKKWIENTLSTRSNHQLCRSIDDWVVCVCENVDFRFDNEFTIAHMIDNNLTYALTLQMNDSYRLELIKDKNDPVKVCFVWLQIKKRVHSGYRKNTCAKNREKSNAKNS